MNEAEQEKPAPKIIFVIYYVVGLFFLLVGVIGLIVGSYLVGLISVVISILLIPSLANKLKTLIQGSSESTLGDNPKNKKVDASQEQVSVSKPEINGKQAQKQGETPKSDSETTIKFLKKEPITKQPEYLNGFKGKTDDNNITNGAHKQTQTYEQKAKPLSTSSAVVKDSKNFNEIAKSASNIQKDPMEQLLKDIDKVLKNKHTVNYQLGIKTLKVELNKTGLWHVESLRSEIFEDTLNIIRLAAKSQNKIMVVIINYATALPDENQNYIVKKVYSGHYSLENFHSLDWNGIKKDEREDLLWEKAEYFWLHTILKNN